MTYSQAGKIFAAVDRTERTDILLSCNSYLIQRKISDGSVICQKQSCAVVADAAVNGPSCIGGHRWIVRLRRRIAEFNFFTGKNYSIWIFHIFFIPA